MSGHTWQNVRGQFVLEIYSNHIGIVFDMNDDTEIPELNGILELNDSGELVIDFLSSGYYQPMSMYGGPDHLGWPAEGSEDRELDSARVENTDYDCATLTTEQQNTLFNRYESQISEVELEND